MKLLVRADDLGYSEAVNYGIHKAVTEGIVTSLGLMVNMPSSQHGVDLFKNVDVCLGCHTNISAGRPISNPNDIPSLVTEEGEFKASSEYRLAEADFVDYDEVFIEVEAQYNRFIELTGKKPDYFDIHAVASHNFIKAVEAVAIKYNLLFSGFPPGTEDVIINGQAIKMAMDSNINDYNPHDFMVKLLDGSGAGETYIAVFHPGYLDGYLLNNSSLTITRTKEVEMLTDPAIRQLVEDKKVELISYMDLG